MTRFEIFLIGLEILTLLLFFLVVKNYLRLEKEYVNLQDEFIDQKTDNRRHENTEIYYEEQINELQRKHDFIQKDLKKIKDLLNERRTNK